jgi:hypothetical protein
LFGTFYGVVFTIYTIYVLTAAEAYGLFSRCKISSSNTFYSVLFGTFYGVVFTIYTIYVLTAAEAYGLFSRGVKFNFNYIKKKKKKVS